MNTTLQRLHRSAWIVSLASLCASLLVVGAQEPRSGNPPPRTLAEDDVEFLNNAAAAGLAEVETGRLAAERAERAEVKDYARQLVDDHSQANERLKALAQEKGVTLPTRPDADHRRVLEKLKRKSGAKFDAAYIEHMIDDHQEAIELFERTARKTEDEAIRAYASGTLPTLRHHADLAVALRGKGE